MPNRIIRDGWVESVRIDQLSADGERFFLRLCLRADDFGRYHANPLLLKSNLFPLREDIRSADVSRCLAACEKAGLVRCYNAAGGRYLVIEKFDQRTRALVSKFPPPASGCQSDDGHVSDRRPADDRQPRTETEAETDTKSETEAVSSSGALPESASGQGGHLIEVIYAAYPRKQGKMDAIKAIAKAMQNGQAAERLLERTQAYAAAVARWNEHDRQFVPHPATWFNRGSFDDDPKTWEREYTNARQQRAPSAADHAADPWGGKPQ